MIYVAEDGSWGDASGLHLLDNEHSGPLSDAYECDGDAGVIAYARRFGWLAI